MSHLKLFSQIPIGTKFRFEAADRGQVFEKITGYAATKEFSDEGRMVSPSVLVFPVPILIEIAEFRTTNRENFLAVRIYEGKWGLYKSQDDKPIHIFNTLEDVIHHLES